MADQGNDNQEEAMQAEENNAEAQPVGDFHFGDSDLSDVVLISGRCRFHVHKMVLASRSKYFKGLFYMNYVESEQAEVKFGSGSVSPAFYKIIFSIIYHSASSLPEYIQPGRLVWAETMLKLREEMEYLDVYQQCTATINRIFADTYRAEQGQGVAYMTGLLMNRTDLPRINHEQATAALLVLNSNPTIVFTPEMVIKILALPPAPRPVAPLNHFVEMRDDDDSFDLELMPIANDAAAPQQLNIENVMIDGDEELYIRLM